MTNATNSIAAAVHDILDPTPAANADQIGDHFGQTTVVAATETTSTGWDAYEVWRRFIKEARERRRIEG
jgi:hypothetical protein